MLCVLQTYVRTAMGGGHAGPLQVDMSRCACMWACVNVCVRVCLPLCVHTCLYMLERAGVCNVPTKRRITSHVCL